MKPESIAFLAVLLLLHGCSNSGTDSRSGNVPQSNESGSGQTTGQPLQNVPALGTSQPSEAQNSSDNPLNSLAPDDAPGESNSSAIEPDAMAANPEPTSRSDVESVPATIPRVNPDANPEENAQIIAEENAAATVQPPPPAPEPEPEPAVLNEIEKAILNAPGTTRQYPPRIDNFNFQDDSPGKPVPDVDKAFQNSPFNNTMQRVSSADKFSVGDTVPTHQYSKRQAWNSNETLIAIGAKILRTSDYKIMVESVPISSARNWSHKQPEIMFGFRFNGEILNEFGKYNVAKDSFALVKRFDNYKHCTIGNGEGSVSNDDRFVVFTCVSADNRLTLISFDIRNRTILGTIVPERSVDWAGVSQSGKYIVVANQGSSDADRKLIRYKKDFSERYLITTKTHHGDLGIDQYGDDVIVMIGPTRFSYIRLKDKHKVSYPITDSANPTGFGHVSCRNIKRPGWCYVSTYNQTRLAAIMLDYDGNSTLSADEDGEYSFEGVNVVEAWGIHRSTSSNYHKTPRASASPSGNSMVFSSDWYGSTGANAYVISAPSGSQ